MAIGAELRDWRKRRRLSQLELALEAGISARHLSFVETGRASPGRDLLVRLTAKLELPFRERNQLLVAAGYAPAFPQRPLDDPALAAVRAALDLVLTRHEPNPAIVFDRHWNLVAANAPMLAFTAAADIDPALLEPPVNVLRVGLHPRGLGKLLVNYEDWHAHFRGRLERQVAVTGDERLVALLEEVRGYAPRLDRDVTDVLGPLKARAPDGRVLSFFGMFATFDTPFEVTASELALELGFPADSETAAAVRELTSGLKPADPPTRGSRASG